MTKSFRATLLACAVLLSACPAPQPCTTGTAGTAGCACIEGTTCGDGLACGADGKCAAPVGATLQVSDATARGCELLVTEAEGTTVSSVTFKNGAKGTWVREAPKVAVTVVSGGDASLAGAVEFALTGPASTLAVSKASCFDLKGARLTSTLSIR